MATTSCKEDDLEGEYSNLLIVETYNEDLLYKCGIHVEASRSLTLPLSPFVYIATQLRQRLAFFGCTRRRTSLLFSTDKTDICSVSTRLIAHSESGMLYIISRVALWILLGNLINSQRR